MRPPSLTGSEVAWAFAVLIAILVAAVLVGWMWVLVALTVVRWVFASPASLAWLFMACSLGGCLAPSFRRLSLPLALLAIAAAILSVRP